EIYPPGYYLSAELPDCRVAGEGVPRQASFPPRPAATAGHGAGALDVGGGTGWMLDLLRSLDARVRFTQVVDLDPEAGAAARARGHAYACERIEEFTSERRFDLVLMLNLIEHVEAPREVLSSIAK